jgi:hypothetical protein
MRTAHTKIFLAEVDEAGFGIFLAEVDEAGFGIALA